MDISIRMTASERQALVAQPPYRALCARRCGGHHPFRAHGARYQLLKLQPLMLRQAQHERLGNGKRLR
jgi:hypothetical protein